MFMLGGQGGQVELCPKATHYLLTYSHCRIYFNLLLRERCSRNLAFVTSQTMKHIHIHFSQDASDDDVLAVLKDASARVEYSVHFEFAKCDLLESSVSKNCCWCADLEGAVSWHFPSSLTCFCSDRFLQEMQHCCMTLLARNGASSHLCSAGHEAQAYHFGFHS